MKVQAFKNHVPAYVTYAEPQTLQISILDYFLTSMTTNTKFEFSGYMKQSLEIKLISNG